MLIQTEGMSLLTTDSLHWVGSHREIDAKAHVA